MDRISFLINEMEIFSDDSEAVHAPVNIHEVLQHVKYLAESGFASHIRFKEQYDPSLPDVMGNRDRLIQLFLNLVKNAAEAIAAKSQEDGVIILSTAYISGPKFKRSKDGKFYSLPIQVSVEDNGAGIPETIRKHLFDPFVTTKQGGRGLGLAVVSKIAALHGAAITIERSRNAMTQFKIMLPVAHPASA